jgi:RNA polymerase sigma-70 factor (ECF subfamily)
MARLTAQRDLGSALHEAVRLAKGDAPTLGPDAFDRLVAEYQRPVTRLVHRLLGWRGDVEDVVQDVFLAALKNFDRFRGEATAWTWLAAIAINRCRSYRRRRLLEFRWLSRAKQEKSTAGVDRRVEPDETAQRVRKAVTALPIRDREVIVLYYLEEMTVADMAKTIGSSPGAIDVRLHRARTKLREILQRPNKITGLHK